MNTITNIVKCFFHLIPPIYYLLLFGLDRISEKIISLTTFSLSKVKEFENISFSLSTITLCFFSKDLRVRVC